RSLALVYLLVAAFLSSVTSYTAFFTLSLHDALPIFGADIAFDADPKFFACLVRFESSSVPTTLPTAYDVYPLDGRNQTGKKFREIGRAVQQECRDRYRMPSSA